MKRLLAAAMVAAIALTALAQAAPRNVTDPDAPRSLPDDGPVAVQWTDPAQFTDLRFSGNRWESRRGNWVAQLAEYLRDSAEKRLPAGQRLDITITDIERAGRYEPGRGPYLDSVRILREIYPPTMTLQFRRYDAEGQLVDEGERKLRDTMYLSGIGFVGSSDHLRYEKRMIDDWLRRELPADRIADR